MTKIYGLDGHPRLSSLQLSVLASVVVPLALVLAAAVYAGLAWSERLFERRLQEDIELLARAVQQPLGQSMDRGDHDALENVLDSVFAFDRVYGASVYDVDGQLVAAAGGVDDDLTGSRTAADAVSSGEHIGSYRQVSGRDVFSYFTPMVDAGGRINGLLQITRTRSDIDERIERLRAGAWLGWAVFSVLIGVVTVVGHYGGVGRHVAALRACMRAVEKGERDLVAAEAGPRELRQLARGLNHMVQGVSTAERQVAMHRDREQELNSRLRHSEKLAELGRVAGGVAHELGAPLNVVDGRARRVERLCHAAGVDADRDLQSIRAQVRRMASTVRQLGDICRHSPGQFRAVDPEALKAQCLQLVGAELERCAVQLSWASPADSVLLYGDSTRLEQALTNLLINAIQAARSRVWVEVEQGESWVEFRINDDGPGVDPDVAKRLFEPFFTTKAPGRGTGLGLALVLSIVDEHGGDIRVGRNVAGGAVFTLSIPRWQGDANREPTEPA